MTTIPQDRILRYLLPSAPGSIRGNGIYFRGELYDCDHPEIRARMSVVAARRLKKTRKPKFMSVSLKFNPDGKADELYVPVSTGDYAACKPKTPAFASLDRWELEEYEAADHADKTRHGIEERQIKAAANARRDEVVRKARARTEQEIAEHGLSQSARKRNKRETLEVERRLDESADPVPALPTPPDTRPVVQPPGRKYVPPPSYLDLISEEYDDPT